MILRTPTDQASAARAAQSGRLKRIAQRNREWYAQLYLRRQMNMLCWFNRQRIPFPELMPPEFIEESLAQPHIAEDDHFMVIDHTQAKPSERFGFLARVRRFLEV